MAWSNCASQPPARAPAAVAKQPARLYQPKQPGASVIRDQLRQRRLLDGQKRADFAAAGTDNADDRRQGDPHRIGGEEKDQAGQDHQGCSKQQHILAANPVGHQGHPEGNQDIAGERGGENGPDPGCAQAGGGEIEPENDRNEAVGEQPGYSGGKEQDNVTSCWIHGCGIGRPRNR
jgi:hypothetical protein